MALRHVMRSVLAAALALPLAACGTGREDPLVSTITGLTGGLFGGDDTAEAVPVFSAETVPPDVIALLPGPLMLLEVSEPRSSAGLTRVGQNGPNATWRGPNGLSLTVDGNGVLRSTRGFGFDLMSGDVRPIAAALAARRAGGVQRMMIHLDGEAQQIRRVYDCEITLDGSETLSIAGTSRSFTRMTENCRGADGYTFQNVYWLNRQGRAVQSRQWVSAEIGSIRLTVLRD